MDDVLQTRLNEWRRGSRMATISVRLSSEVHAKLARVAWLRRQTKSELVRAAIDRFLGDEAAAESPLSALELAGDLVGCVKGPGDLSTGSNYMQGFGK